MAPFCATTETAADLANDKLSSKFDRQRLRQSRHRLDEISETLVPPTAPPSPLVTNSNEVGLHMLLDPSAPFGSDSESGDATPSSPTVITVE